MPKIKGDPLQKITLNLYSADVIALRQTYGFGWSEQVREVVKGYLRDLKLPDHAPEPYTIGDLEDE